MAVLLHSPNVWFLQSHICLLDSFVTFQGWCWDCSLWHGRKAELGPEWTRKKQFWLLWACTARPEQNAQSATLTSPMLNQTCNYLNHSKELLCCPSSLSVTPSLCKYWNVEQKGWEVGNAQCGEMQTQRQLQSREVQPCIVSLYNLTSALVQSQFMTNSIML